MKTSKAIIMASVIILLAAIVFALSNRYYITGGVILDRFTGDTYLVRDRLKDTPTPTPAIVPNQTTKWQASDFEESPSDFSKVVISGDSYTLSSYKCEVTCTVKNDDSIPHTLSVKCIFYDKNDKPILTEESGYITVKPNDIESVTLTTFTSVENIASYELKLIQSIFDEEIK